MLHIVFRFRKKNERFIVYESKTVGNCFSYSDAPVTSSRFASNSIWYDEIQSEFFQKHLSLVGRRSSSKRSFWISEWVGYWFSFIRYRSKFVYDLVKSRLPFTVIKKKRIKFRTAENLGDHLQPENKPCAVGVYKEEPWKPDDILTIRLTFVHTHDSIDFTTKWKSNILSFPLSSRCFKQEIILGQLSGQKPKIHRNDKENWNHSKMWIAGISVYFY